MQKLSLLSAGLAIAGESLPDLMNKTVENNAKDPFVVPPREGMKGSTAALEHWSNVRRRHVHSASCIHGKDEDAQGAADRILKAAEKRERKRRKNLKQVAA